MDPPEWGKLMLGGWGGTVCVVPTKTSVAIHSTQKVLKRERYLHISKCTSTKEQTMSWWTQWKLKTSQVKVHWTHLSSPSISAQWQSALQSGHGDPSGRGLTATTQHGRGHWTIPCQPQKGSKFEIQGWVSTECCHLPIIKLKILTIVMSWGLSVVWWSITQFGNWSVNIET